MDKSEITAGPNSNLPIPDCCDSVGLEYSCMSHQVKILTLIWAVLIPLFSIAHVHETLPVRTIVHEAGETEIVGKPKRIVVLEYSFVDALASVGISPVGIADDNDPSRIAPEMIELIGDGWFSVGLRTNPDLQAIDELGPDLIIADARRHSDLYPQLSSIAPTIVLDSVKVNYWENLASLEVIGQALGREDLVHERLEQHRMIMYLYTSAIGQDNQDRVLSAVVWDEAFNAHTSSAYTPSVLEMIGLSSAIESDQPYARLDLDQIADINPDIMFLMVTEGPLLTDQWAGDPRWENIPAVMNGRVFKMNQNLWARQRGIVAAELISEDVIEALYNQ